MPNFQSPDQIIRPEILALSAYHVPPATGMIKLDAMENPYPLPAVLREEIAQLTATAPVNRYPDASAASLKAALRQALAISDEMDILEEFEFVEELNNDEKVVEETKATETENNNTITTETNADNKTENYNLAKCLTSK